MITAAIVTVQPLHSVLLKGYPLHWKHTLCVAFKLCACMCACDLIACRISRAALLCTGSGSAFVSVRIGFLQNRRDKTTGWGTCHTVPATAGIVTVECSTSGVFFRGFPHVRDVFPTAKHAIELAAAWTGFLACRLLVCSLLWPSPPGAALAFLESCRCCLVP